MGCTAEALDKGRRVVPRQSLTYTSSFDVSLALYVHRHLSLSWCVWEVDEVCDMMGELVQGFLVPMAAAAPKAKANLTACCKQPMGSKGEHLHKAQETTMRRSGCALYY